MFTNFDHDAQLRDYCKNEGFSYYDVITTTQRKRGKESIQRLGALFSIVRDKLFNRNLARNLGKSEICCKCC